IFNKQNATLHVMLKLIQKLKKFNWEIHTQPPYFTDTTPSNYHLFQSSQNCLKMQKFDNSEKAANFNPFVIAFFF
ncbi:Histone-lysine N-methyltransferase SETMAR, partial [Habropoda laboriosa]